MSNFAFGTYRISDLNALHIEALKEAIDSGITMIDTSSNYMDGGAERAIALAFREYEDNISSIEIVSKYGYIQGSKLENIKKNPINELVKFSEECYHCISTSFLEEELSESLKRLERDSIDCYLIHNPEYYLLDAISKDLDKNNRLDEMYKRIENAFVGLENEIKKGRIKSYGISSNSFSKANSSEEFLPYEDLITLAERASLRVGNKKHSFTTIELPINILETEGLKCASWAKENGLRVLANRPLNAKYDNKMYRLCDYDESHEYYHHLNELLQVCDNDTLRPLFNLLEQLDESKHKFAWIGYYDSFLYTQIIPHMSKTLEVIDEKNRDTMFNFIDLFLKEYRKMILFECSRNTKSQLKDFFSDSDISLQAYALKYLLKSDVIDYILVGMRKPSYVNEVFSLKN